MGSEEGAFVSVVSFGGNRVVTTLVPTHGQVTLHTWGEAVESCAIGQLSIASTEPPPVASVVINLGCRYAAASTFPALVDVPPECLGSDDKVDVLVVGYAGEIVHGIPTGSPVSTLVGRAQMVDGYAEVIGEWQMPARGDDVAIDASLVPGTTGVAQRLVDGLLFNEYSLVALPFDSVRVRAGNPDSSRFVQLVVPGVLNTVQLMPDDFLPAVVPGFSLLQRSPLAVAWDSTQTSDAVRVEVAWQSGETHMFWTAVLPADTSELTFPQLTDEGIQLPVPGDLSHPVSVQRTYVDADEVEGFDAVLAGGLYLVHVDGTSTTLAPTSRRIRSTSDSTSF